MSITIVFFSCYKKNYQGIYISTDRSNTLVLSSDSVFYHLFERHANYSYSEGTWYQKGKKILLKNSLVNPRKGKFYLICYKDLLKDSNSFIIYEDSNVFKGYKLFYENREIKPNINHSRNNEYSILLISNSKADTLLIDISKYNLIRIVSIVFAPGMSLFQDTISTYTYRNRTVFERYYKREEKLKEIKIN